MKRVFRVGRCLCARARESGHGDNRGRFSCIGPHGERIRVRVRGTYARRLNGLNTLVSAYCCHRPGFSRRSFRCRTSIVVPIFGERGAVTSTILDTVDRGAGFGFGIVIMSGRSASHANRVIRGVTSDPHLFLLRPADGSLKVNKY